MTDNATKSTDTQSEISESQDRLLHDLNGPITNARGFTHEIREEFAALKALVENNKDGMNADQVQCAHDLVVVDMLPLLDHLHHIVNTLDERVQQYAAK